MAHDGDDGRGRDGLTHTLAAVATVAAATLPHAHTETHAYTVILAGTLAHVTGTGSNTAHGGSRVAR